MGTVKGSGEFCRLVNTDFGRPAQPLLHWPSQKMASWPFSYFYWLLVSLQDKRTSTPTFFLVFFGWKCFGVNPTVYFTLSFNLSRYLFALIYREYILLGACNALLTQFLSVFHSLPIGSRPLDCYPGHQVIWVSSCDLVYVGVYVCVFFLIIQMWLLPALNCKFVHMVL